MVLRRPRPSRRRISRKAAYEATVTKFIHLMEFCERRCIDSLDAFNDARYRHNRGEPVAVPPDADDLAYRYSGSEEKV